MQRPIEFRAWDTKQKKMFYDGDYYYLSHFSHELREVTSQCEITNKGIYFWVHEARLKIADEKYFDHAHMFSRDIELMQYTGLKDKHGIKIFEKDILEHYQGISIVNFDYFSWGLETYHAKHLSFHTQDMSKCEVIGNIYENPELLKG